MTTLRIRMTGKGSDGDERSVDWHVETADLIHRNHMTASPVPDKRDLPRGWRPETLEASWITDMNEKVI